MAQAAFALVQVSDKEDYKAIKKRVVDTLQRYKRLPHLIEQAEAVAAGQGLARDFRAHVTGAEFEQLAAVGQAYAHGYVEHIHQQKAETLFAGMKGDDAQDQEALDRIAGLMTGTAAWGGEAVVWHDRVMRETEAMRLAEQDVSRLKFEKAFIERALNSLKSYAPRLEKLIRCRYFDFLSPIATAGILNVSVREQDNLHRKAISELALLLRISNGC